MLAPRMTMTDADAIAQHVELLHTYHLNLWTEIEGQLRVLRVAQEEIAKLRDARIGGESKAAALSAAQMLSRHVQTLQGRVATLGSTVQELSGTVSELVTVLSR